jgi:hypothetical protein
MKKVIGISLIILSLGIFSTASAQVKEDVEKTAKKVGNKTAEVASKGKARVTDKVYKDKQGPDGQTIYIDKHSRYYWIDKKGHRHYVVAADLRDKVKED